MLVRILHLVWPARTDRLGDEALLSALGLGDPEAATTFVRRFQSRVYGLALAVTLDAATAQDVAQAAFERAWRHAEAYDVRRGAVSTWLLTITRNLAIDAVRARRARPMAPEDIGALLAAAPGADPSEAAVQGSRLHAVRGALDALPTEQRRAVLLATVASRTSPEIAEIEGVPVATAKYRVQSGLRKLRAALRPADETHRGGERAR